jgi:protein-L-isoaspartate(D-aspartate) O-methyltransferase
MIPRDIYTEDRRALVALLRRKGISDDRVLDAIAQVPRHEFVLPAFQGRAYEDVSLPIGCNQTISQPYTVAFMTQSLRVDPGLKILEIGTGSGYQACILALLGARVFTMERHLELLEAARLKFDAFGLRIASKAGDGSIGWTEFAPYDRIIVTAGAPEIPQSLASQLTDGGILVIPVGSELSQTMMIVERRGEAYRTNRFESFKFVPLVGKEGWKTPR